MNRAGIILIALFCLLFQCKEVQSQEYLKKFELVNPNVNSVKVPFELINNLIIIPIYINNSEELHFIFDTGVKTPILAELFVNDSLSFTYSRVQTLQGLGEGRTIEAYPSFGNTIRIEGMIGKNQDIYFLGDNDLDLSSRLGTRVNGMIGYDLLKDFVVEVNYQYHYLVFHDPGNYKFRIDKRSFSLPLQIIDSKPYLNTTIELSENQRLDAHLLLDIGGGFALWLSEESDSMITMPEKKIRTYLGYGLNGEISGYVGTIHSVHIGPNEFVNPIVAFPDSGAVINIVRKENRNGSIGAEIMRRYNLIIDYPNKRIILKPNNNFHDEFSFNRSGIEVIAPIPGAKVYFVSRVEPGSNAEKAGVKVDDQILSINLKLAAECSISDINTYFHGKSGKKLKMRLMRDGKTIKVEFPLINPFDVNQ